MSIIVTPQPDHVPPRVRIDVNSDDPAKPFAALTITRDGKPIREQPYIGGSEAVVFDYEAPFGVPVTYSATGEIATYSPIYTETWSSLSGWTTNYGPASVSGGHFGSGAGSAQVQRAFTFPSVGRLESQGLAASSSNSGSSRLYFNSIALENQGSFATLRQGPMFSSHPRPATAVQGLAQPFALVWDSTMITLITVDGTWAAPRAADPADDRVAATTNSTGFFVEDFNISVPTNSPFAASATTTLDVSEAWLIHPSLPSLSCPIDAGPQGAHNLRFIEASSGETKSSEAQRTIHRGIGSRRAVVITSGPRTADEWTLILGAPTIQQKNAVRAIVDDQTPLLLRIPPSAQYDLPDDWYSVGDLTVTRLETPNITEETSITLPLTPVDEPIVRQGPLWTYGSDLLLNATYADSRAAFPSYLDRLAGAS